MSYYLENCSLYLNDCLNYPVNTKCSELARLIDCGSIKDLHDFFPTLVKSIFGYPGWGLRTITREINPIEFEYLYNFFIPMGPMLRLCYRLLSEPIKFDVPIEALPTKTIQMLNSGRYSVFYSDILNIDPYRRQVASLQLNAFDYFIFYFVTHGMIPLHKQFPAALTVHNDHLKTAYFYLTADYLCTFLPSDPNTMVMPANVFCSVKSATMPISPIVPMRTPKYLSANAISHNFTSTATSIRTPESSRSSCWRSETVLHLFVDTWLRYGVDESQDLPSSEFIRVVRVLVKQLHAFANSAELDISPMASLRSLAQPMMNAQINVFLHGIMHRWPLDSSFSVVLELWLSFIQPWRYTLNKQYGIDDNNQFQAGISPKYERFIIENSASYTQIFIQLLPRFERLDFESLKNVSMLFRLAKVFGQSNLAYVLRMHETRLLNEHISSSPIKSSLLLNTSSHSNHSSHSSPTPTRLSLDVADFGDSPSTSALYAHRSDMNYLHEDDSYVCMFGPNMVTKLEKFTSKIFVSYENAKKLIYQLENSVQQRYSGFWGYIKWYLINDEEAENSHSLADARKITEILEYVVESFAYIFEEELPNLREAFGEFQEYSRQNILSTSAFEDTNVSDNLNLSQNSPRAVMLQRIRKVKYTGDPSILPAQSNEFEFLVRILYKISRHLNETYASDFERHFMRNDFIGTISRHLLEPPRTIQTFEKSHGISRLIERSLGPRIDWRWLASHRTIVIAFLSLLFGKLLFGGPIFGFFILILFKILMIFVLSTYEYLQKF